MDLQLNNKRAFVTGSTAGIGYATALQLAREGAEVVVNGRMAERMSEGVGGFIETLAKDQVKTAAQVEADFFQTVRPTSIIQRFLNTNEVANMVTYLASPLASATNGAAVRVDGGLLEGGVV